MSSSRIDSKKSAMVSDSSNPESLLSTKTPDKSAILPTRSRDSDDLFPEIKPQSSRDPKPVKRQIFSPPRKSEKVVKLPERFVILEEFFNGLDTAIRLLKLKGSSTTFANICPKIQFFTNRVLLYGDLAQMKHIYPEAIEVKRVLKYDEGTSCMKPSLHISLNTDAVVLEDTICGTKYMELRKVFHKKLVDFYKAHPKDEIPKELLPEPFNSPKMDSYSDTVSVDWGASELEVAGFDVSMEVIEQEQRIVNNESDCDSDKVSVDLGASKLEAEGFDVRMEEMEEEHHTVDKVIPDSTGTEECLLSHTESSIVATPVKDLSTSSKDLSTPIRLMSATPTLQPSRRCITMTPDDGLEKRSSRTRCLNFDALEEDVVVKDEISDESDDESVDEGSNYEADDASHEVSGLHSMKDKREAELEKQNLPKLVDLIHKLFHSTKRTLITKEELLHKLIACQINITDRKEVEEQLKSMLQLVPDWISETKASSGGFLVRINQMSTAETVRARLEEATATSQGLSTVY
ncbi:hypothetical protein AALP_AA5G181700 [Arabis alpina]|uniref:CDT1 Geminin-binding domain-containing protein n=1 Tax=Arabis alpina TaxID=50452 RepID=A0A087GXV8_ARAAL|nr:hypothetical protein AALP_AA5G181700 [Arabis alpina]